MDILASVYASIIVASFISVLLATINYISNVFQQVPIEKMTRSLHIMIATICVYMLSIVIFMLNIVTTLIEGI